MIMLRKTHNRVVNELEKDIELRESVITTLRQKKRELKSELLDLRLTLDNERTMRKSSNKLLRENLTDAKNDAAAVKVNNDILKQRNLELEEKIKSLEMFMFLLKL